VTGSLFNDGEVEQTVHSAYQIHKKIHRFFYKIGNGYCRPTACISGFMSNFDKHDGQSSFKSAILFPLDLFFSSVEMELIEELKLH
jgi:DNA mismatch repair protein MutL